MAVPDVIGTRRPFATPPRGETGNPAPYTPPAYLGVHRHDWLPLLRSEPCAYCTLRPGRTVDHIEPRADGGRNHAGNLVGCCPACNIEKGDRSLLLFLLWRVGVVA